MLEFKNISKIYNESKRKNNALNDISFRLPNKGFISIIGKSGSGKTTILNILSGIIKPTSGSYFIDDRDSSSLSEEEWNSLRSEYFSYVFQENNLINNLTVYENLSLLLLNHPEYDEKEIDKSLEKLDILSLKNECVSDLSGGEKERVAIARALFKHSKVILADEVTASLDEENSINVFKTLKDISKDILVIVVTHDVDLALEYSDFYIKVNYGSIKENTINDNNDSTESLKIVSPKMPNKNLSKFKNMVFKGFKWQSVFSIFFNMLVMSMTIFTLHLLFFNKYDYTLNIVKKTNNYSIIGRFNQTIEPFSPDYKLPNNIFQNVDLNIGIKALRYDEHNVFGYEIIDNSLEDDMLYFSDYLIDQINEFYSNEFRISDNKIIINGLEYNYKKLYFNIDSNSNYSNFINNSLKGNENTIKKLAKSYSILDMGEIDGKFIVGVSNPSFKIEKIELGTNQIKGNEIIVSWGKIQESHKLNDIVILNGEEYIIKGFAKSIGVNNVNGVACDTVYFSNEKFNELVKDEEISFNNLERVYEVKLKNKDDIRKILNMNNEDSGIKYEGIRIRLHNDYLLEAYDLGSSVTRGWLPVGYILLAISIVILLIFNFFNQKVISKTQKYKLGIIYFLGYNKKEVFKAYNLSNLINVSISFLFASLLGTVFVLGFNKMLQFTYNTINWYIIAINPLFYLFSFLVIFLLTTLLISNTIRKMYKQSLTKLLTKE